MTLATKSENAEIAVLQDQMGTVKEDIREVKNDVKTLLGRFDIVLSLRAEIDALKVDQTNQKLLTDAKIAELKSANFRNKIVYPTIAGLFAGLAVALIVLVLKK